MSEPDDIRCFVERVLASTDGESTVIAVFNAVRDLPYATDASCNAGGLVAQGSGNCVAKAQLLGQSLGVLDCETRSVRWTYAITDPFADLLPVEFDVHTATQIRLDGSWVTIDATHDAALPVPPFVVNSWDGRSDTELAYEPTSTLWIPGEDDAEIEQAVSEITTKLAGVDTGLYSRRFNEWLRELRSTATTN